MSNNVTEINIEVVGESTGEKFWGVFGFKNRLSHADELRKDKLRKEYLGPNPKDSSTRAQDQAEVFSQLSVRVVKAPGWWVDSQNGLLLSDDSVIAKIFEEALSVEKKALEEIQKKAQEAKQLLSNG
jgi:hypothetical protein